MGSGARFDERDLLRRQVVEGVHEAVELPIGQRDAAGGGGAGRVGGGGGALADVNRMVGVSGGIWFRSLQ